LTFDTILLITLHQLNVGNIGPETDGQLCAEICQQNGYSGSAMVPTSSNDKSCACFDNSGRKVLNLPIEPGLSEKTSQQDQTDESDTEYYCRVVSRDIRPVKLIYKDATLSITPAILGYENQSNALFAVRGSSKAVHEFSKEVVLKINGETPDSNFSRMAFETSCGEDVYFIDVNIPGLNTWPDSGVEIFVPSIKAMFDIQIQHHSIRQ
jgi:hypothetical protein